MFARTKRGVLVLAWAPLMVCGGVNAQVEMEPQGIDVAPSVRLYPDVGVHYITDDNFFSRPKGEEERVSGTLARAGFAVIDQGRRAKIDLGASVEGADFDSGDEDDYVDSKVYGQIDYGRLGRHNFTVRVSRDDGHDPFGRRRTENLPLENRELDEYHENRGRLSYRFGNPAATINLQYEFLYFEKEYETNREEGTRFLDFTHRENRGTLYYNYSAKTAAVVRVSHRDIDYPLTLAGFPTRDASERRALIGLEWQASAKTNGKIFVGAVERDRDAAGFDDFTGVDWDVRIDWAPRQLTTFSFTAGRDAEESFLLNASFIDTRKFAASWRQQWGHRFASTLGAQYLERDFEDLGREDESIRGTLDLEFAVSRSFSLTARASYYDRDSTEQERKFEKNVFTVGFRLAP